MGYIRAHIRLNTTAEVTELISMLNSDGTTTRYTIESFDGTQRVNARSMLGVIYAMTDFNDEMYFVNETEPDNIPSCIDKYRVNA